MTETLLTVCPQQDDRGPNNHSTIYACTQEAVSNVTEIVDLDVSSFINSKKVDSIKTNITYLYLMQYN